MNFGGTIRLNRTGWILAAIVGLLILFIHLSRTKSSNSSGEGINLKSLLIGAIEAAELGGRKVIAGTKGELRVKSKGKTREGANDPVTDADFASHCEMYNSLLGAFPAAHIKSEEEASKGEVCPQGSVLKLAEPSDFSSISGLADTIVDPQDVTIWIDPLDATKEYTDKLHQYVTTMVCIAFKGKPIIGVIHQPFTQHTSWAWVDHQLSPDLQQPKVEDKAPVAPHITVSMSHKGQVDALAVEAFGHQVTLTSAAGAGYKVLEVVHSKADVYLHNTQIKKWDICAGDAIVTALGGRMTTLKNETLDYSHHSDAINEDGLLVAVQNHNYYMSKLSLLSSSPIV